MKAVSAQVVSCCVFDIQKKLSRAYMALFHTCLTMWPIQLFISFLQLKELKAQVLICCAYEMPKQSRHLVIKPKAIFVWQLGRCNPSHSSTRELHVSIISKGHLDSHFQTIISRRGRKLKLQNFPRGRIWLLLRMPLNLKTKKYFFRAGSLV